MSAMFMRYMGIAYQQFPANKLQGALERGAAFKVEGKEVLLIIEGCCWYVSKANFDATLRRMRENYFSVSEEPALPALPNTSDDGSDDGWKQLSFSCPAMKV